MTIVSSVHHGLRRSEYEHGKCKQCSAKLVLTYTGLKLNDPRAFEVGPFCGDRCASNYIADKGWVFARPQTDPNQE